MPAKRYFCINNDTELLAGILSNGSKSSCDKSAQLDGTIKQSAPVTNGMYNDGKTAAKYQSSDNGSTWKYIGQMEIKD